MSLTDLIPAPYRWLILAAMLAAAGGFGYVKGLHSGEAELDAYKLSEAGRSLQIQTATIAKTAQLQKQKDEADHAAAEREKKLRADAARAGVERDGLRRELADSRSKLSTASPESLRKRVAALEDVFEQCSRRYSELAERADRHASDAVKLQEAWPK